jgi:hypothetical protein
MRHRLIAVTSMLLRRYFGHLVKLCEGSVFSRTEQVLQRVREGNDSAQTEELYKIIFNFRRHLPPLRGVVYW